MKILLLDIETAPNTVYTWGLWNQNIGLNQIINSSQVLCWAAKWYGEKQILFDSTFKSGHKRMLARIHKLLGEADVVVHYYGSKFDIPTLNKEFLVAGFDPPAPFKQVDLCTIARREFKFSSNKLDWIAQSLGVGSKIRHKGFELWIDCMNNVPEAWADMEAYNVQDVVLLEKVYDRFMPWIKSHPNHSAFREELCCPKCGSGKYQRRGTAHAKYYKYARFQCKSCRGWFRGNKTTTEKTGEKFVSI